MNIKERLLKEVDKAYKNFNQKLIPNINNILGVRVPVLRKISKEIYKNNILNPLYLKLIIGLYVIVFVLV